MKYLFLIMLFCSCSSRASNEMEDMTRDVLKAKQGIEIDVKPLPKDRSQ